MSLFWYPAINYEKMLDGKIDKKERLDSYVRYFLARLQSMFVYENLPETIPAKWLEHYLLVNGNCVIGRADDGNLYAFFGGMGGDPDAYYIPTRYVVANPYLNFNHQFDIQAGGDGCIIYNDTYSQGLLPMLQRYCMQLVENDVTMNVADIMARAVVNISCQDDQTKASAELWLKRLKDGDLTVLAEKAFIEGLHINEFYHVADCLTNLIEYHQYIKASLYNDIGLNSNYNMKREAINSNESQLNDDMLHPLIDDMLRERQEGIARVNEMFGTNIIVRFNSAWSMNEREEQATIEEIEAQADLIENESELTEAEAENANDITSDDIDNSNDESVDESGDENIDDDITIYEKDDERNDAES